MADPESPLLYNKVTTGQRREAIELAKLLLQVALRGSEAEVAFHAAQLLLVSMIYSLSPKDDPGLVIKNHAVALANIGKALTFLMTEKDHDASPAARGGES